MIANLSRVSPAASPTAGRRTADKGVVAHIVNVLATWWRAHSDRRHLSAMNDEMLRDVGLSRSDVEREFQRPFWEPIDYKALDEQRAIAARRSSFGLL
jgi:uncharacterized protein YjiS (DUF1127 family)